jgi:hypothetical protein
VEQSGLFSAHRLFIWFVNGTWYSLLHYSCLFWGHSGDVRAQRFPVCSELYHVVITATIHVNGNARLEGNMRKYSGGWYIIVWGRCAGHWPMSILSLDLHSGILVPLCPSYMYTHFVEHCMSLLNAYWKPLLSIFWSTNFVIDWFSINPDRWHT